MIVKMIERVRIECVMPFNSRLTIYYSTDILNKEVGHLLYYFRAIPILL